MKLIGFIKFRTEQIAGFCEHCNYPSGSKKCGEIFHYLRTYYFLREHCVCSVELLRYAVNDTPCIMLLKSYFVLPYYGASKVQSTLPT